MQDMLAAFMQQSQQQNQTMLAIVEKFGKSRQSVTVFYCKL